MPFNTCSKVCGVYHAVTRYPGFSAKPASEVTTYFSPGEVEEVDGDGILSGWSYYQSHHLTWLHFFKISSFLGKEHTGQHLDNSVLWWCKWWAHLSIMMARTTLRRGVAMLYKLPVHKSHQSCLALQENAKKQWQNFMSCWCLRRDS